MARDHLDWPFFEPAHRTFAIDLAAWIAGRPAAGSDGRDVDARCRDWVRALGQAGWLKCCVESADGGLHPRLDSRTLCVGRETLAYHDGMADFMFAMQGLGSGAITLAGSAAQRARWLPPVAEGAAIAAFALSEPDAGSDVGAMQMRAKRERDGWMLDGCKTWISNGGIADFYCVFARTSEDTGFKLAMRTLDIFRASVAAAALGLARRALDEALQRARSRRIFGQALGDFQITQAKLADMASAIDAAALLTYRAAWLRDVRDQRTTMEAAMAKMVATESAQTVIDAAVQMFGGQGVVSGETVERLYREIRALRIYEGATEAQKLVIGRELLRQGGEDR